MELCNMRNNMQFHAPRYLAVSGPATRHGGRWIGYERRAGVSGAVDPLRLRAPEAVKVNRIAGTQARSPMVGNASSAIEDLRPLWSLRAPTPATMAALSEQ